MVTKRARKRPPFEMGQRVTVAGNSEDVYVVTAVTRKPAGGAGWLVHTRSEKSGRDSKFAHHILDPVEK